MAKTRAQIWNNQTLTASAGNTTSAVVDLSSAKAGSTITVSLTNGASGPTLAAQVQVQTANDYNAGSPTLWGNYGGALVASATNSAVSSWSFVLDEGWEALRLVAGSNTGQNVRADADISIVT